MLMLKNCKIFKNNLILLIPRCNLTDKTENITPAENVLPKKRTYKGKKTFFFKSTSE